MDPIKLAICWIYAGNHFMVSDPDTMDGPCQIFRTSGGVLGGYENNMHDARFARLKVELRERHIMEIAQNLVHSVGFSNLREYEEDGQMWMQPVRCLYGFKDRVGRLPDDGDMCSLGVLGGTDRLMRFIDDTQWGVYGQWGGSHSCEYRSEICLHIDRLSTGEDPMDFMWKPAVEDCEKALRGLSRMEHNPFVPGGSK